MAEQTCLKVPEPAQEAEHPGCVVAAALVPVVGIQAAMSALTAVGEADEAVALAVVATMQNVHNGSVLVQPLSEPLLLKLGAETNLQEGLAWSVDRPRGCFALFEKAGSALGEPAAIAVPFEGWAAPPLMTGLSPVAAELRKEAGSSGSERMAPALKSSAESQQLAPVEFGQG